jgi:hypothetical protein
MRECGYPCWKLLGLECIGWSDPSASSAFAPFVVVDANHFLFQGPYATDVTTGDMLGQAPHGVLPMANGHEVDITIDTLNALSQSGAPQGATAPAQPNGIFCLARSSLELATAFDYYGRLLINVSRGAELIYWARPTGGRVLNAGTIGAGWALDADCRFGALMKNVLFHFGVRPRTANPSSL